MLLTVEKMMGKWRARLIQSPVLKMSVKGVSM